VTTSTLGQFTFAQNTLSVSGSTWPWSLKFNEDVRILQDDKGNSNVVMAESNYKDMLNTLLQVQALLSKHRTVLSDTK
jgi:hypothetical protein